MIDVADLCDHDVVSKDVGTMANIARRRTRKCDLSHEGVDSSRAEVSTDRQRGTAPEIGSGLTQIMAPPGVRHKLLRDVQLALVQSSERVSEFERG
jgi:hypothetical protein